ncbi:serine--tRNA ligase [Clostridia bacterium]|nr:serine--tRNA ligase [Clostridia bacterium]
MIDIRFIRSEPEKVKENLVRRGVDVDVEQILNLDQRKRDILGQVEEKKAHRNSVSKSIGKKKKAGEDVSAVMQEMRSLGEEISSHDEEVKELDQQIFTMMLQIPNMLHESVPSGEGEEDNVEIACYGEIPHWSFEAKNHWEIGEELDIIDPVRAGKVTGARFTYMKDAGARLERALINFMLDLHCDKQGYKEIVPPFLVNSDSMLGTGQLPKFADDMFKVQGTDYYLIPTAEVPLTNMYAREILEPEDMPQFFTAYTPCFRAEAGSAGKDTRGLIRQHQFNKVEMVKYCRPEDSYVELEKLIQNAMEVLDLLKLPYRTVLLCSKDVGFSATKTIDLEVYMPGFGGYREISSCSNFEDFQARRAGIKFRREKKGKPEYVHTLNGSGLAVGRTVAAILENYQQEDGSVRIPKVLLPYMGGKEWIK